MHYYLGRLFTKTPTHIQHIFDRGNGRVCRQSRHEPEKHICSTIDRDLYEMLSYAKIRKHRMHICAQCYETVNRMVEKSRRRSAPQNGSARHE